MKKLILLLAIPFLLSACLKPIEVNWQQKLTLYIDIPQGEVVASAVYGVRLSDDIGGLFDLPDGKPVQTRVTGEAVVAKLPNGKYLFALMKGKDSAGDAYGQIQTTFADVSPETRDEKRAPLAKWMKRVKQQKDARVLPARAYPLLVTFDDVSEPKSVRLVDPADLAATFGAGYALREITLQITREPVTEGVVEGVLGWLEGLKGKVKPTNKRYVDELLPEERLYKNDFVKE
jgi:hypothetical protein